MKMYQKIRTYIINNGMKLNHVADKAGIERKRFYRLMDGSTNLEADDLEKIIKALDVEPNIFFTNNFLETKNTQKSA